MLETTIILQGKEAKQWAMMKALEALGVFDIRFGKVIINFDGESRISNIEITKNYRLPSMDMIQ